MPDPEDKSKGFTVNDRRGHHEADAPAAQASPEAAAPAGETRPFSARTTMPEIDFGTFVMSFASSALVHLGEMQAPDEPGRAPNLPLAKQTIDILGMLADKTRGNLTRDEESLITHLLYDLRLKYVEAKKRG